MLTLRISPGLKAYNNQIQAKYQIYYKEAAEPSIRPVYKRRVERIHRVLVKPRGKTNPTRYDNNRHDKDRNEPSYAPTRHLFVIQQDANTHGSDNLHYVEHQRVERARTDVEVQC